jgi:hypothetical protein
MNSKFFVIFQYINNKKSCYKNYSTYVLKHVFSNICHKTVEFSKIGEFLKKSLPGIHISCRQLLDYIHISGAVGGKTGKTSVLPRFSKIERGGGSGGGAPHWWS